MTVRTRVVVEEVSLGLVGFVLHGDVSDQLHLRVVGCLVLEHRGLADHDGSEVRSHQVLFEAATGFVHGNFAEDTERLEHPVLPPDVVPVLLQTVEDVFTEAAVESLVSSVVMLGQPPPAPESFLTQATLQLTLVSVTEKMNEYSLMVMHICPKVFDINRKVFRLIIYNVKIT